MGTTARRSIWAWGLESEEPSEADRKAEAKRMVEEYGTAVDPPPLPTIDSVNIRTLPDPGAGRSRRDLLQR